MSGPETFIPLSLTVFFLIPLVLTVCVLGYIVRYQSKQIRQMTSDLLETLDKLNSTKQSLELAREKFVNYINK